MNNHASGDSNRQYDKRTIQRKRRKKESAGVREDARGKAKRERQTHRGGGGDEGKSEKETYIKRRERDRVRKRINPTTTSSRIFKTGRKGGRHTDNGVSSLLPTGTK